MPYITKGLAEDITKGLAEDLSEEVKREKAGYWESGTWDTSRHIRIEVKGQDIDSIHYELRYDEGKLQVELHFESEDANKDRALIKKMILQTKNQSRLAWKSWLGKPYHRCVLVTEKDLYNNKGNTIAAFKEIMGIFDPLFKIDKGQSMQEKVKLGEENLKFENPEGAHVSLHNLNLAQILQMDIRIPAYQRDYCWEDAQIDPLFKNLQEYSSQDYHLGTIILQQLKNEKDNVYYDVIDGQQRLITLSLLAKEFVNNPKAIKLLSQEARTEASQQHIANCKWKVEQFVKSNIPNKLGGHLLNHVKFSVLVIYDNRLYLAQTFFSNQNSKGVPLSDLDLLKAHHLRFIYQKAQEMHTAQEWDAMRSNQSQNAILEKLLFWHIYELRHWMRKQNIDENEKNRVLHEFSAAEIIKDVPPFGEKFEFYEKIQGGAHFFNYVKILCNSYEQFEKETSVILLRNHLSNHWSHARYAEIIEAFLFAYYLKFSNQYLPEALYVISLIMGIHRFNNSQARTKSIREFASSSEIVMMIDQATSPTFFLAEGLSKTQNIDISSSIHIAIDFYCKICDMAEDLSKLFTINSFSEIYDNRI